MNAATKAFANVLSEAAKSTKPKGFMGLLSDNSITLRNLLFSAVVVGLELLLNSQLFDCPLKNHVFYGTMFLVAPFFIVFITNVLLVGEVWKVTDRCCVKQYRRCGEFGFWVCPNVFKAFVGPCVWLIASFADTEYYVCAAVGQDVDKRNLTNATEVEDLEAEFAQAKSTSHILAWFFFSLMVTGTAIVMCTKKCCLKDNVLLEDPYILERREAISALVTFRHFIGHPPKQGDIENGGEKKTGNIGDNGAGPSARGTAVPDGSDPGPGVVTRGSEGHAQPNNAEDKKTRQNKAKDAECGISGRFMGKEEDITVYPDGIPEQSGNKRVEELFKGWSNDDSWHYQKVHEELKKMYPRVVSGKPKDPWVAPEILEMPNVLRKEEKGEPDRDPNGNNKKTKKGKKQKVDPI